MDPTNFSGLPVWIQGFAALAIALGGLFAGVVGYRKKSADIPINTTTQVVGGAFADRNSIFELAEAIRNAAKHFTTMAVATEKSAEEMERLRYCIERYAQLSIDEYARLREVAARIAKTKGE